VWLRGRLSGVVDWDAAARGDPGYDLAMCRVDLALLFGQEAPALFLRAYEAATGRPVAHLSFWDLYRAWWSLPNPERWLGGLHALDRTDLTAALLRTRLDAFIADGLARARQELC
jgi:aminoglycoside phosphotransferase (APT) family kinase protein